MENTNEITSYNTLELSNLRDKIEVMSQFNQIEILRILNKYNKNTELINENRNGIHVNLSGLNSDIIKELFIYVNYVNEQEDNLNKIELNQQNYKKTYFEKDVKENA